MNLEDIFAEALSSALDKVYNIDKMYSDYAHKTREDISGLVRNIAIGTGAGFGVIPGTLIPDLIVLFEAMFRAGLISGCVIADEKGLDANCLAISDAIDILCLWCGAPEAINDERTRSILVGGAVRKAYGTKVRAKTELKAHLKSFAKAATKKTAKVVAKKAAPKIAGKFAVKAGTKTGAKEFFKWLGPMAGATVNAGLNWWFVSSFRESAFKYYDAKFSLDKEN
jgi:hypothetical protein